MCNHLMMISMIKYLNKKKNLPPGKYSVETVSIGLRRYRVKRFSFGLNIEGSACAGGLREREGIFYWSGFFWLLPEVWKYSGRHV